MAADKKLPTASASGEVDAFLRRVAAAPAPRPAGRTGRLLFGMDATASREPTWDRACRIQGEMFAETAALGGLEIQLAYYRGFEEFEAFPWLSRADELQRRMAAVSCRGGQTQIARLLRHAIAEAKRQKIDALVFVGDCMEENPDRLCHLAGQLGLLGVPVFVFHEGGEARAARTFQEIARLTRGAYCRFDAGSARQLRELLAAVAVYAAGGRPALQDFSRRTGGAALLLSHLVDKG
jgi:hypothetical protein